MWFVVALIGLAYYGIRIFIEQWKMLESSTVNFYKTKARFVYGEVQKGARGEMKKAKKLEKRIRVMEEKIDGLDAMLEKMFLCVATLQVENAHTVVPTCRAVREGWGRLLQNTQQTKEIVSEMNFQLKLREEDAAKG